MTTHEIAPAVPDLKISRMYPCVAWDGAGKEQCGATPTEVYFVVCSHCETEERHLCAVHAAMAMFVQATCRRCATMGDRSHSCLVAIVPEKQEREPWYGPERKLTIVGGTDG
jgi:hypothetical protein